MKRDVHVRLRHFADFINRRIFRNAHDAEIQGSVIHGVDHAYDLTDGVVLRPVFRSHCLVHNDHRRAAAVVLDRESAAAHNRRTPATAK
jgi:hypothetical protein